MNLSGQSIKNTYGGLLNIGATGLTGALKTVTDGFGNPLPMQVSQTGVNFTGDVTGIPGVVPVVRTGSALLFDEPAVYGTPSSPSSGNITLAAGTNNSGVLATLVHSQRNVPDFGSEFQVYNNLAVQAVNTYPDGYPSFYYPTGNNSGFGGGFVSAVAETSDGKLYVAGPFLTYQGATANSMVRLNSDGTLDTSFDAGIGTYNPQSYGYFSSLAVASDNKVYCAGSFVSWKGATAPYLIRLNTDGSLDTSFNTGISPYDETLIFNGPVVSVKVQSDGKVLAAGGFTSYQGSTANRIIRLNTDGTKDTTFNNTTGFNNTVNLLAQGINGAIWVQGAFTSYKGTSTQKLVKLSATGSIAPGWSFTTGVAGEQANIYTILSGNSDDTCYIGGSFLSVQGATSGGYIARITATGAVDTSFNGSGWSISPSSGCQITSLTWAATGSTGGIIVNGNYLSYNGQSVPTGTIVKLTSTGATAAGFSGRQIQSYESQGNIWSGQTAINNGSITDSTGKSIFMGNFDGVNEQFTPGLVRINSNGSWDETLDTYSETAPVINYIGATYLGGIVKYTVFQ